MPLTPTQAAHLLRRAGFGGTFVEINEFARLEPAAAVERLLDTSRSSLTMRPSAIDSSSISDWEKMVAITEFWLDACAVAPNPFVEKMTLFWHGLFVTGRDKVYDADYLWRVNSLHRQHGLGNVRTLIKAVAVEPAMLLYLDNQDNYAENPNQNFGRELLELFLLGVGNYSEADVDACTRAWTGHHLDDDNRRYVFRANYHDNSAKTFMGVTRNWDGPELIDFLFDDPTQRMVVARHIVRRLWSFLAYPSPAANIVEDLAAVLAGANFEMRPLLRALFARGEFWSSTAMQGLMRGPMEYLINIMHQTGLRSSITKPMWVLDSLGQDPFNPPNVSGWRQNRYWLSAAASAQRASWARDLGWRSEKANVGPFRDIASLPIDQAVPAVFGRLGIAAPSDSSRTALTNWFNRQRAAQYQGWAENQSLHQVALMLPELQMA